MGKANEGVYVYRPSCRSLSLMLSCLTVLFCCVVYSRGNRTPESEKKQTSVYLIKTENEKENFVYLPGTYVSLLNSRNSNRIDAKETAVVVAETEKEETVGGTSLRFSTDVVGSSSSI